MAHDLSPYFLQLYAGLKARRTPTWKSFTWQGLEFKNPLGVAGGVDKDGEQIQAWWNLGAGFIEVGTVTPQAQPGNSGQTMSRNLARQALWNRMGFPSRGAQHMEKNLAPLSEPHLTPIFVNIGKNARTPLETAQDDYLYCLRKLSPYADALVINISSPNTAGLRELLKPQYLHSFLQPLAEANRNEFARPLILKLSPDMSDEELETALEVSLEVGFEGWIFTNTSTGLREGLAFPKEGGVSGGPLALCAKNKLKKALEVLGPRRRGKLLISCGGVLSPEDAFERLELGADLVQVYSALVFCGPSFFQQVAKQAALKPPEVLTP